jgi:hypothetical protein
MNVTGSPDITETIFSKIAQSDLFIGDVSIINSSFDGRKTPNPNVLIELGYAANILGWERVICIYNTEYGSFEDLPFDLRQKRILTYDNSDNKQKLVGAIESTLKKLYGKGLLFNPIADHIKGKIDYCMLEIAKHFSCLLLGAVTMSDALSKVNNCLNLEQDKISNILKNESSFLGFFAYNNLDEIKRKFEVLLDTSLSSKYARDSWIVLIIDMLHWLRGFQYILSNRKGNLYIAICQPDQKYKVISANEMNNENPKDSYILLKKYGSDSGIVLNTASLPKVKSTKILSPHRVDSSMVDEFSSYLFRGIEIIKRWMALTGNEFILDPEHYYIT